MVGIHKIRRNIDDDPLIKHRIIHGKPMNVPVPHKHNIIRLQGIRLSLDHIADISLNKNRNLIKIMIVVGNLMRFPVGQMKKPEFTVEIAFFCIHFHKKLHLGTG